MMRETPWHNPGKWYSSPHHWDEEVRRASANLPARVYIKDDTLREGEDTPGARFTPEDRLVIAQALQRIGVAELEIPMEPTPELTREVVKAFEDAGVTCSKSAIAFRRPPYDKNKQWQDKMARLAETGVDTLTVAIAFSIDDLRSDFSGSLSKAAVEEVIQETVGYAKSLGVQVGFGWPNQTRTLPATLIRFHKAAVAGGADRVHVYDSLGMGSPLSMRHLIARLKAAVGTTAILIHCHNDFGLAVANTLAAIEAGATWCDVVVNGLGDRGGNAAFEEVVMALEVLYGVDSGIQLDQLYSLSRLVEEKSGVRCQPHKAIVGRNAFMEQNPAHVNSVRTGYQQGHPEFHLPYVPELVGQTYTPVYAAAALYEGAVENALDGLGIPFTASDVETIRQEALALLRDRSFLTEEELAALCTSVLQA